MTLTLMNNHDDSKKVRKNVTVVTTRECSVYGDCSLLAPTMILKYDSILSSCNYAYIEEFGRYYFMGSPVFMAGGRCLIYLTVDPLMSHSSDIEAIYCNIVRCEQSEISMIPDSDLMTIGNNIEVLDFSEEFTESAQHSYVLAVLGGV